MTDVTYPWALLAGVLSFLSPCVLPLVPPYLTYLAGATIEEATDSIDPQVRRRAVIAAALFVLGFSTVFVLFGASAFFIGQWLRAWSHVLSMVAGVAIIIMGLHFLGVFRIPLLYREARFQASNGGRLLGAYVMGLAFAFGWTPCIGPVLGAILGLAGSTQTLGEGVSLLMVYSLGLGVPFLVAALAMGTFIRWMRGFRAHLGKVEKAMGALLALTGVAFMTGGIERAAYWLQDAFPQLMLL
ncbi:MAG: cytochrome C biogenesis protein [Rhizobiales bacterium 65-9]|nr:cytochrome c biogenesis protein CcdA [Hyphomicrobiales bacterium]OJY34348.1 MAG: cytochrome C biogenesis protein [Rhizobiales bacterium 65-9]